MCILYLGAAYYFAVIAGVIDGDAWSRVENAQRALFSRDPHLAAIGFIWSPLPTLALLPLVAVKGLLPQLTANGLAAGIVSATCMAGAAVQIRGMLADAGLNRFTVTVLSVAFAFHPLIVYYAANGMSEAMLLLFLVMATRHFARWLQNATVNSLITAGIALSLAYLTRYEALAAATGVVTVTALVSFRRERKQRGRITSTLCDVFIVGGPTALAFITWAITSWLITGQALSQFTSIYGNASQIAVTSQGAALPTGDLIKSMVIQMAALEPLLLLVLVLRVETVSRRILAQAVAAASCLGGALAFLALGMIKGSVIHELRFFIELIPLAVMLAGVSVTANGNYGGRGLRLNVSRLFSAACLVAVVAALPVSTVAMLDSGINEDSGLNIRMVLPVTVSATHGVQNWSTERRIASDLDRRHLPPGSVLLDDFLGFPIVLVSDNPRQFVITSDRDFESILADPKGAAVEYILVPQPGGLANLDAVNRKYPVLFDTGDGLASLARDYPNQSGTDVSWRLYRIN